MTTLTIQVNSEKSKRAFEALADALGSKIIEISPSTPNKTTINAINELKDGKGTKYESVDDMVKCLSK
jgi:hypothetical protein